MRSAKTVLPKNMLCDGRVRQKTGHVSRDLKTGVVLLWPHPGNFAILPPEAHHCARPSRLVGPSDTFASIGYDNVELPCECQFILIIVTIVVFEVPKMRGWTSLTLASLLYQNRMISPSAALARRQSHCLPHAMLPKSCEGSHTKKQHRVELHLTSAFSASSETLWQHSNSQQFEATGIQKRGSEATHMKTSKLSALCKL